MLTTTIIIAFIVLFAVVLLSVSVGLKFLESKRKKDVSAMLKTASGEAPQPKTEILKELKDGSNSIIERVFNGLDIFKKIREYIKQADLTWSVEGFCVFSLIGAVIGGLIGTRLRMLPSPLMGPIGLGAAFGAVPFLYGGKTRSKRMKALEDQLPDALDFMARSMRAGHAFVISLQMVGEELPDPMGREFRTLFNEHNLGAPLELAMRGLCDRIPLLDLRFFSSAVMLQKQTGGNLSDILTRLSYVIRERFRLRGQIKAASAHGRMTAMILGGLPLVTVVALLFVAPGYLDGMADDPDGRKLIAGAMVGQVIGNMVIRKIINIQV
ncbi:MAG TPA: type II secretion system F family protein [Bryobacteraceae bacterium]